MTKLSGSSHNHQEELLQLLQDKFPEVFTEGRISAEKLKATLGESVNTDNERYGLNWAGKSDCFRHIQEPVTATLKPQREESVDFDETENLFMEGDNLEVLKVMQKSYYGKVKMIYIDPPYNTGNDSFIYPDKFEESKEGYLERVGEKEAGQLMKDGMFQQNSKENGHYHSNWLSMMYPRLFLARNLMRDDGVIFVSIDDNEVHNLRMVMNEVFGEENFVTQLVWEKKKKGSFLSNEITSVKEYILVFSKNSTTFRGLIGEINDKIETYPCVNESNKTETRLIPAGIMSRYKKRNYKLEKGSVVSAGSMHLVLKSDLIIKNGILDEDLKIEGRWRYKQESMEEFAREKKLYLTQDLYLRRIVDEPRYKTMKDLLPRVGDGGKDANFDINDLFSDGWGSNEDGSEELNDLLDVKNILDYPKPLKLLMKLVTSLRDENSIICDFFAGSGTTAHAVMALNAEDGGNRKCISVQLPEACDEKSEAYKAGYETIADIAKERIRRAGKKISAEFSEKLNFSAEKLDTGFKVFKLDESNFKIWRGNADTEEALKAQLEMFVDNVKKESTQENVLYELVLKSGLDLNISAEKKSVDGKDYFVLGQGELIVCLEDALSQTLVDAILAAKPLKVVVLDKGFQNDDQLKTNTLLQAEDEGVDFKVI